MADDPEDNGGERLFVYGTLVDPAERFRLLRRIVVATPARLEGFARGRREFYFVVPRAGATTAGAVLEGLGAHDFAILDEYEDVPDRYTRERVEAIASDGGRLACWIYLPTKWAH